MDKHNEQVINVLANEIANLRVQNAHLLVANQTQAERIKELEKQVKDSEESAE